MDRLFDRVLVVGAHMDDPEFLAGGTISRFARTSHIAVFSDSRPWGNALRSELESSMGVLGVKDGCYDLYVNLPASLDGTESFTYNRRKIANTLLRLRKELNPTLVITHQMNDSHQDHGAIRDEVIRCFKASASILLGGQPWNDVWVSNRPFFVRLTRDHLEARLTAIACYASQLRAHRKYFDVETVQKAQLEYWGGQIGCDYAEAFQVVRLSI